MKLAAFCESGYEGDRRLHIAALYRAGRSEEALQKPWQPHHFTHLVTEGLYQGMLRLKTGQLEEARLMLQDRFNMIAFMDREYRHDIGGIL